MTRVFNLISITFSLCYFASTTHADCISDEKINVRHSLGESLDFYDKAAPKEIFEKFSNNIVAPWVLSAYPKHEVRDAAKQIQIFYLEALSKLQNWPIRDMSDTLAQIMTLQNLLSELKPYTPEEIEKTKSDIDYYHSTQKPLIPPVSDMELRGLCLRYFSKNCPGALKDMLKFMDAGYASHLQGAMSAWTLWKKVLSEDKYAKLFGHATLIQLEHLLSIEEGQVVSSNIWDDFQLAASRAGFEDSKGAAMEALAVYATRGSGVNAVSLLFQKHHELVATGLYMTSVLTNILDIHTSAPGKRYFLPEGVKFSCPMGRPYHFWMAAYLSYLTRDKDGSRASQIASHTAGYMYEFFAQTYGRDPFFMVIAPIDHPYLNLLRHNIAIKTSGAQWGSQLKNKEINVDEKLLILKEKARPIEGSVYEKYKRFQNQLERFNMSHQVLAPDSAL